MDALPRDILGNRLLAEYASGDQRMKLAVIRALKKIEEIPACAELLARAFQEDDSVIRAAAVKTLGKIARRKDPALVSRFIADGDPRVRAAAAEALEEAGDTNAAGLLFRLKGDAHPRVRANALKALWHLGRREGLAGLSEMMADTDEAARVSAVWALGEIAEASPEAMALLKRGEEDASEKVREQWSQGMKKFSKPRPAAAPALPVGRYRTRFFEVVKPSGLLRLNEMPGLKSSVLEAMKGGHKNLAFDFSAVEEVDAAAVRLFYRLNKRVAAEGGRFMIFNVTAAVMELLKSENLDTTVLIFGEGENVGELLG